MADCDAVGARSVGGLSYGDRIAVAGAAAQPDGDRLRARSLGGPPNGNGIAIGSPAVHPDGDRLYSRSVGPRSQHGRADCCLCTRTQGDSVVESRGAKADRSGIRERRSAAAECRGSGAGRECPTPAIIVRIAANRDRAEAGRRHIIAYGQGARAPGRGTVPKRGGPVTVGILGVRDRIGAAGQRLPVGCAVVAGPADRVDTVVGIAVAIGVEQALACRDFAGRHAKRYDSGKAEGRSADRRPHRKSCLFGNCHRQSRSCWS